MHPAPPLLNCSKQFSCNTHQSLFSLILSTVPPIPRAFFSICFLEAPSARHSSSLDEQTPSGTHNSIHSSVGWVSSIFSSAQAQLFGGLGQSTPPSRQSIQNWTECLHLTRSCAPWSQWERDGGSTLQRDVVQNVPSWVGGLVSGSGDRQGKLTTFLSHFPP